MQIKSAKFVTSSPSVDKTPATTFHEYAFIGRSNVGKSSLINMLTGRKALAMTSATPGKTMLINHFIIDDRWYIVDLPGYGFAQRSKKELERLDRMIKGYILGRKQMTNLFVLIDSRLEPQKIDLKFMEWLGENGVPFSIVFTKLDKLSKQAGARNVAKYCEKLLEQWEELPPVFMTSSADGRGREELLNYIAELNKLPLLSEQPLAVPEEDTNQNDIDTMDAKAFTPEEAKAQQNYPGAAIDAADDNKVTAQEIKENVCMLDSNARTIDDQDA